MWYDLTQPFHPEIPHSTALPSPELETLTCVEDDGSNVQRYAAPTHVGTHVDAPRHFVPGGATIDELPLDRFAGPAVVLDLGRDGPGEIPLADIEAAAEAAGGVRQGDVVCVRTGWGAKFTDHEAYQRYPWLAPEVADWLLDRGAKLLAVDTISPDQPRAIRPAEWDAYPHHRTLLPAGVLIAEHLYLEDVAGERVELFGFPMKLRGGDGAPVRFAARPPE
ncbi:MAG: cyclase family protein [Haloarculaceae archaeon]